MIPMYLLMNAFHAAPLAEAAGELHTLIVAGGGNFRSRAWFR
jgi:hypothetical protein